jgi:hypothetical protein
MIVPRPQSAQRVRIRGGRAGRSGKLRGNVQISSCCSGTNASIAPRMVKSATVADMVASSASNEQLASLRSFARWQRDLGLFANAGADACWVAAIACAPDNIRCSTAIFQLLSWTVWVLGNKRVSRERRKTEKSFRCFCFDFCHWVRCIRHSPPGIGGQGVRFDSFASSIWTRIPELGPRPASDHVDRRHALTAR